MQAIQVTLEQEIDLSFGALILVVLFIRESHTQTDKMCELLEFSLNKISLSQAADQ